MTGRDALLDAIEVLTKRRPVPVVQERDGHVWTTRTVQDSLLAQLRDAKVGGIMQHAGGSDGSERLPFNTGAVTLYTDIEDEVSRWFVDLLRQPVELYPEVTLRKWFRDGIMPLRRRDSRRADVVEKLALRQLTGWTNRIISMFDPPQRLELTTLQQVPVIDRNTGLARLRPDGTIWFRTEERPAPCPRCGEGQAYDPTSGDRITSLVVEYRRSEGESALHSSEATCRFCGATWKGERGIRELRWHLDNPGEDLPEDGTLD